MYEESIKYIKKNQREAYIEGIEDNYHIIINSKWFTTPPKILPKIRFKPNMDYEVTIIDSETEAELIFTNSLVTFQGEKKAPRVKNLKISSDKIVVFDCSLGIYGLPSNVETKNLAITHLNFGENPSLQTIKDFQTMLRILESEVLIIHHSTIKIPSSLFVESKQIVIGNSLIASNNDITISTSLPKGTLDVTNSSLISEGPMIISTDEVTIDNSNVFSNHSFIDFKNSKIETKGESIIGGKDGLKGIEESRCGQNKKR